jgi:1-aminocyclopropane-1-carboxylate deaminase
MISFRTQVVTKTPLLSYTPTPVQEIHDEMLHRAGIRLLVKREDLNHPQVSGNKWWKLLYNLEEARRLGKRTLLTFGGAYSNHIYATAAAARELGFRSIGIIRGEEAEPLNATLQFARQQGMQLQYISREEYRQKDSAEFQRQLYRQFGDVYVIPEGGTNALAIRGCKEFARVLSEISFDYACLAVGTGGTMAGLIEGLNADKRIVGVSVLKGDFLTAEVDRLSGHKAADKWSILTDYHHGGYAKTTLELLAFMQRMVQEHDLPLDQVYTAKLMWAVMREVECGVFDRGATVLAIHTGGLQGRVAD